MSTAKFDWTQKGLGGAPGPRVVTCEEARELCKRRGVKVFWRPSHLEDGKAVAIVTEG